MLGFSGDPFVGNLMREFPVAAPKEFPALADFLLSALYEGYSGSAQMSLQIEAPDAEPDPIRTKCRAVS